MVPGSMQQAMEAERVVGSVEVTNVEGAGGSVGLAQLASSNDDRQLMTMGLVMGVGAGHPDRPAHRGGPGAGGAGILATPHPGRLVTAWRADPGGTPIAGGSAGGADQILAVQIAKESGIDPKSVNYVAFSGGGESLAALLGGQVAAGRRASTSN